MSTAAKLWTMQDLLDMPDDGVRRWIINGELREELADTGEFGGQVMTVRNRFHSEMMANITTAVNNWRYSLPEPRGRVVCGANGGAAGVPNPRPDLPHRRDVRGGGRSGEEEHAGGGGGGEQMKALAIGDCRADG